MVSKQSRVWAPRMAAWRASGKTSEEFCKGRGYTAGGLQHWAHLLSKREEAPMKPVVRVARVVTRPAVKARQAGRGRKVEASGTLTRRLSLEVGEVRIVVERGFDPETLEVVLGVLGAGGRS